MSLERIKADQGLLYYLITQRRPDLAAKITDTNTIETLIVGLGGQGTRHAGLMAEFGTNVTAGIAPGRGGTRIHEVIPVYDSVKEALEDHPGIAVASIWRHYSTAKDATLEVIEAGIPIVVLISEGIPLRDVRDILVAARKHNTLLLGGNTPGIIFPPEGVKVGMLPDVFHPEEVSDNQAGPHGVTILSRSGAILYHLSDALASAGIAQNAVMGVGGDGAIGSRFIDLVSLVMGYENTDVVVIAGEIGGAQEEILAQNIKQHPEKYPKPLIALISGANAPEGKTMGHAGAVVAPGQAYGTHASKKTALEEAGVTVVNNQHDLVKAVQEKLGRKKYFEIDRYYDRMREKWEEKPPKPSWGTLITKVEPNNLMISGYALQELVEKKSLLEIAYLLVKGDLPDPENLRDCQKIALVGARESVEPLFVSSHEDISKSLAKYLLVDEKLAKFTDKGKDGPIRKMMFCLGRVGRYFATILGNEKVLDSINENDPFSHVIFRALTGQEMIDQAKADILETMASASVDHGVTPPSAQATIIAASTRAAYEVGVASGVGAITDVHGGAGAKAAEFFLQSLQRAKSKNLPVEEAVYSLMKEYIAVGRRIEGMGHRIHTKDPRRDILWKRAESSGLAKGCVEVSKMMTDVFDKVRGMYLPINVDGVIGAIVADLGLDPSLAKALFVWGRVAGLSAHYYEEIASQPQMRRIAFGEAVYKGKTARPVPNG
ncbi:MAG: citrate/2-methylcitrate synthase [Candidatus Hodarchaeota archaeon]